MPLDIQLAIQGGGAKIVALMAALEAVDELQEQTKILRVTRIAGTSAGALVGALYSAGPNKIKEARIRLQNVSAKQIRKIFPSPFSVGNAHRLLKLLRWGDPLWSTAEIEHFLGNALQGDRKFNKIVELAGPGSRHIELKVVSANLSSSSKEVHRPEEPLIQSLLSSSGLPFCFRTWSRNGSPVIVDGGICENLPSEELDQPHDIAKYGRVVGITFTPSATPRIDNALTFTTSLLETAMQNAMERARQRLGDAYLHRINTTLSTFDFEQAVECIRETRGEYELIRKESKDWFEDFIAREASAATQGNKVMIGNPWATQGISMMDKLGEVYRVQHGQRSRVVSRCSLVVRARCLAKEGSPDFQQPDVVKYSGEFHTGAETLYCQRINVTGTLHESLLDKTKWSWTDLSNKKHVIRAIDIPMRSKGAQAGKDKELLLFLDPPLAPHSGPYLFEFEDLVHNFMEPLKQGKKDDLFFLSNPHDGVIKRLEIVLLVPDEYPHIRISSRNNSPGKVMGPEELGRYEVPFGYRAMGWFGEDVIGGTDFGIWLNE